MDSIYYLLALPLFSCVWFLFNRTRASKKYRRKYRGKTKRDILSDRILHNHAARLLSSVQKIERIKAIHHQLLHPKEDSYVMEYRKEIIDMCLDSISHLLYEERCAETQDELVAIQKDFYALLQPPFL